MAQARTHRLEKWHGLGNDYLLREPGAGEPLTPALVRALCDYHVGVGSDGVLDVLDADGAEAEIVIWNPDGSTAELSGNGTRIAARWLALRSGCDEVVVRVGPREVRASLAGGQRVRTVLGPVVVGRTETIEVAGEAVELTPASVGNPHAVIRREPERAEVLRLGPLVERHPRFPQRTNVQLVRVDGPGEVTVGVWERGAGETLASGTSATAVAGVCVAHGWCASPVTVHLAGGDLLVELDAEMCATVTGEAERICGVEVDAGWLARRAG